MNRPASPLATTTTGSCCPSRESDARTRLSRSRQAGRSDSYRRSNWCNSSSMAAPNVAGFYRMVILLSYLAEGLINPVRPALPYSPEVVRAQQSWCALPGSLDLAIPQQARPFARHPQLDPPALVPSKSVIAMALVALHRTAPSALVSRPIFGPTATASDNRAGPAGMPPRSPGSATSSLRHWPRATADTSERAASAGTRQRRRSLAEPQFLDLARIRRYTANSGECL